MPPDRVSAEELDGIGAYCEAATEEPGAYEVQAADGGKWGVFTRTDYRLLGTFTGPNAEARARLFARAHADMPRLVRDLRDAREGLIALLKAAPSADEFRLLVRIIGGTSPSAEALMGQIDRLEVAASAARALVPDGADAMKEA